MKVGTEWLHVDQAATYCGVCPETIRRAVRAGALRCYRVGRGLRFKSAWLEEWGQSGGRTAGNTHVMTDDDSGRHDDDAAHMADAEGA
jgi:excisionase family DNA binding protein